MWYRSLPADSWLRFLHSITDICLQSHHLGLVLAIKKLVENHGQSSWVFVHSSVFVDGCVRFLDHSQFHQSCARLTKLSIPWAVQPNQAHILDSYGMRWLPSSSADLLLCVRHLHCAVHAVWLCQKEILAQRTGTTQEASTWHNVHMW